MNDVKEEPSSEGLLQLAKDHLKRGESNFAAWSVAWTGDAGFYDFKEALSIQQQGDLGVSPDVIAKTQVWVGRSLYKLKQYSESLECLKAALRLQESFSGRYNQESGNMYLLIGNVLYDKGSYSEARLAYATARRVELILFGEGSDTFRAAALLKQALEKMGFTQEQAQRLDRMWVESIYHETRGDLSREQIQVEKAMEEYEIAAALAQSTFGAANPSFSFVRRKMACLNALDPSGSGVNFDSFQADSLLYECRVPKACQAIQQGDRHYFDGDYQGAIKLYSAATIANIGGAGCGNLKLFISMMALLGLSILVLATIKYKRKNIFNKDEEVVMPSKMKAPFSREVGQAIIAVWTQLSILMADNTLLFRAWWFKGKANGSPNTDNPQASPTSKQLGDKNDLQISPVASKPSNNDVVAGFERDFWEAATLAQSHAHETKEQQPIADEIIVSKQHDLQGQDLVTPEIKEEDLRTTIVCGEPAGGGTSFHAHTSVLALRVPTRPPSQPIDQVLAGCCETLGASFALSLTGAEDLEDCDESFLNTEFDTAMDMDSSATPTNVHDGMISQREWMLRPRFLGGNPKKDI